MLEAVQAAMPEITPGEPTMAKPNVHTASRDELVEAGLRAELADEILKRRRKGKIDLEALDEVPGVGPATLEQLRKSLDFREQPRNGDDRGEPNGKEAADKAGDAGKRAADQVAETARQATDQAAETGRRTTIRVAQVGERAAEQAVDVGKRTVDQVAEVSARTADQVAEAGRRTAEQAGEVTRELTDRTGNLIQQSLRVVQGTTDAARALPREVARQSAEGTAELGRTLLSLVHEQTRQNLDTMQALATAVDWNRAVKAVDWQRVFEIQGEFVRASLERSAQLTQRYLEVTRTVMTATASATRQQANKAA
jgi:hypothetical protein